MKVRFILLTILLQTRLGMQDMSETGEMVKEDTLGRDIFTHKNTTCAYK